MGGGGGGGSRGDRQTRVSKYKQTDQIADYHRKSTRQASIIQACVHVYLQKKREKNNLGCTCGSMEALKLINSCQKIVCNKCQPTKSIHNKKTALMVSEQVNIIHYIEIRYEFPHVLFSIVKVERLSLHTSLSGPSGRSLSWFL